jgi:hypothetical protein
MAKPTQPPSGPITLGKMTSPEDYNQLAEQEAALARMAATNESRAQHYAMAAYYARLAEANEKLARTAELMTNDVGEESALP